MKTVSTPLISVIVPIYNVEEYLEDCLMSLLGQTCTHFEVIMINDGSSDNSFVIAEKYAAADDRFRLINQENGGLSVARNVGVTASSGEYIIFLDSDDALCAKALEIISRYCIEDGLNLLFYSAHCFADSVGSPTDRISYRRSDSLVGAVFESEDLFVKMVKNNNFIPSACLFAVRSNIAKRLRFYPNILHEDNLYTLRMLVEDNVPNSLCIQDPLYFRRIRDGSIMTSDKTIVNVNSYLKVSHEMVALMHIRKLRFTTRLAMSKVALVMLLCALESEYLATHNNITVGLKTVYLRRVAGIPYSFLYVKSYLKILLANTIFSKKHNDFD